MDSYWLWTLLTVAIVVAVYLGVLALVARFSLRPFRLPVYLSPGGLGMPQEEVQIGPTPAWYCPGDSDLVALHLHGYMMNRCELVPTAHWLYQRGIGSMLVDFPGHGQAPGETRLGWPEREIVLACAHWIKERKPEARIVVIGSSMGSVAGAFAISEEPDLFAGLVLDSAYTRLDQAMEGWWSMFGGKTLGTVMKPIRSLARGRVGFDPRTIDVAAALSKVPFPVLVMHGDADGLTPKFHAEKNMAALGERGQIVWFEKRRHSEGRWLDPDRYFASIGEYLTLLETQPAN